jgi:hypothetical protein
MYVCVQKNSTRTFSYVHWYDHGQSSLEPSRVGPCTQSADEPIIEPLISNTTFIFLSEYIISICSNKTVERIPD